MSVLKTSTEEMLVHLVSPGVGAAGLPPGRRGDSCGSPPLLRGIDGRTTTSSSTASRPRRPCRCIRAWW